MDWIARPHHTPYTQAPEILNRREVVRAMVAVYPTDLRDRGIGGTVTVSLLIDESGAVLNQFVDESSGYLALDRAAIQVASVYRFAPALNGDEPVYVWFSFPITFEVR